MPPWLRIYQSIRLITSLLITAFAITSRSLIAPERPLGRGCRSGTPHHRIRLIAAEQSSARFRLALGRVAEGSHTARTNFARCAYWKLQGNSLQFPDRAPEAEHHHPGASRDDTRENQGAAQTEFLVRNAESDGYDSTQQ